MIFIGFIFTKYWIESSTIDPLNQLAPTYTVLLSKTVDPKSVFYIKVLPMQTSPNFMILIFQIPFRSHKQILIFQGSIHQRSKWKIIVLSQNYIGHYLLKKILCIPLFGWDINI